MQHLYCSTHPIPTPSSGYCIFLWILVGLVAVLAAFVVGRLTASLDLFRRSVIGRLLGRGRVAVSTAKEAVVRLGDRVADLTTGIDVHRLSEDPRMLILRGFLTRGEAQRLIDDITPRLERSTVWGESGGAVSPDRTSSTANLARSENALVSAIEERAALFAGFPRDHLEPIQFLRYMPGEFFKPHFDYFVPGEVGTAQAVASSGQRNVTLFVYLNDLPPDDDQGCTVFPELGIRIRPEAGAAVLWHNTRPDGVVDKRTLHGGEPPRLGVKYALNIWCRERPYRG